MHVIAQTILKPGDEALVFDPVDFLFKTSMEAAGAKVNLFPMTFREDGTIDFSHIEEYITPKTKMLGLCNPHNPLGKVYPKEDLEYLLDLSEKYGFYIMNDEIWSDIVYSDAKFTSICSFGSERNKRTLSVFGFSKSFGIAGLRVGCIYCQDKEINRIALVAPMAIVNTIKDFNVIEKRQVTVPEHIEGFVKCVNPKCITNNEPVRTAFDVIQRDGQIALRCRYCEKVTLQSQMELTK